MTVIAFDGKTLAADKQASEGGIRHTTTKIRRVVKGRFKGYLVGAAGSATQGNMMMSWFERGADPDHFPRYQDNDDAACEMVAIAPDGQIFRFDFNPLPVVYHDKVYALGNGREVALGAMAMGADARKAVEVASEMCSGCGMGVDVLPLKVKRRK